LTAAGFKFATSQDLRKGCSDFGFPGNARNSRNGEECRTPRAGCAGESVYSQYHEVAFQGVNAGGECVLVTVLGV